MHKRITKFAGIPLLFVVSLLVSVTAAQAQHMGLFERGPQASVTGEHGTYNIAWITLNDQIFLQKPVYELMITYHTPRRGPGAVLEKHWTEMMMVARDEIARRCPPPGEWQVHHATRDYDSEDRAMGAELRVVYSCL